MKRNSKANHKLMEMNLTFYTDKAKQFAVETGTVRQLRQPEITVLKRVTCKKCNSDFQRGRLVCSYCNNIFEVIDPTPKIEYQEA